MRRTTYRVAAVIVGAGLLSCSMVGGCTLKDAAPPPLVGPSELGLSLQIEAVPDTLTQDGISQSRIIITARDASSRPVRDLTLTLAISVGGVSADFGTLSTRSVVTGTNGRAEAVYTAPPPPLESIDTGTVVSIVVTPVGSDYATALPRFVSIRLLPPGLVIPPNSLPVPNFIFSPSSPTTDTTIQFDASGSKDSDGVITSYDWWFGDGDTASGVRTTHVYRVAGTYSVTLVVTDDRGASASVTKTVTVTAGPLPTAEFTISPSPANVGRVVTFDGALSTAPTGRTIVEYRWNFGDGSPIVRTSNPVTTHTYGVAGSYTITLVVTDSQGATAGKSNTLTVNP
jgi:PKD repeat protein